MTNKNIFTNLEEAHELVNRIAEFDDVSMQSIICMSIDMCAAKHNENAKEIAERIYNAVCSVNDDLGKFEI